MLEAQRMVTEKAAAAIEAQAAAGLALARGASQEAIGRDLVRGYSKRVRANRRRLAKR
jgi:hypothetical protein